MNALRKLFQNNVFAFLVRIVLGVLLMYASIDKLANTGDFLKIIHNYRILPVQFENILAIFLPWVEFLTGFCLVINKFPKGALVLYSFLLIIFTIALSQALVRGLDIACGCFSVKPSTTSEIWMRIILDLIMLFFIVNLYIAIPEKAETAAENQ